MYSANAWFTQASPASAVTPDQDTDASQQIYTSSNALFYAQPSGFHFERVDDDHSPGVISACPPNFLTEFVFLFIWPVLCTMRSIC
jgi:hypothetical protein